MKCKELQVGDKVALINGIIATTIEVCEDYAYAVLNGYETMDPWEFNDQDNHPEGILLTKEILEANGFIYKNEYENIFRSIYGNNCSTSPYLITIRWKEEHGTLNIIYIECISRNYGRNNNHIILWDNFLSILSSTHWDLLDFRRLRIISRFNVG